jgi:hypothetical protein
MYRLGAKAPFRKDPAPLPRLKRRPISGSAVTIPDNWRFAGLFVAVSVMSFVVLFWLDVWLRA